MSQSQLQSITHKLSLTGTEIASFAEADAALLNPEAIRPIASHPNFTSAEYSKHFAEEIITSSRDNSHDILGQDPATSVFQKLLQPKALTK